MKRSLSLVLAMSLFSAGVLAADYDQPDTPALADAQLNEAYSGQKFDWYEGEDTGTIEFKNNGKAILNWGNRKIDGKWWVENNELCRKWNIRSAKDSTRCYVVYETPEGDYLKFIDGEFVLKEVKI